MYGFLRLWFSTPGIPLGRLQFGNGANQLFLPRHELLHLVPQTGDILSHGLQLLDRDL